MRRNRLCSVLVAALAWVLLLSSAASAAPTLDAVHVVQRGETLAGIASRYGTDAWTLARLNGIANPSLIYPGQHLVIPGDQSAGATHVMQAGETLTEIALRYGIDVWTIARANGLTDLTCVYAGQVITIPGATTTAPHHDAALPGSFPGPWHAAYYVNPHLTGGPWRTRNELAVNSNWGYGSPMAGVPADYFSAQWTGTFPLDPGTYRFYAKVDDGVRVTVDGHRVIDGWRQGPYRLYTGDIYLGPGDHTIEVAYYEASGTAQIHVWWEQTAGAQPPQEPTTDMWYGEFFANESLAGAPVANHQVPWIGFDWGGLQPLPNVPVDHFSARWTRRVYLEADYYKFCAMIDDGARIFVDRKLVMDEWHPSNGIAYCGKTYVTEGVHEILVQYFEQGGEALIYVWWEPEE